MNEALKRRLVGATVLVSLAIIFLPMLFDSAPQKSAVDAALRPVPEAPGVKFESELLQENISRPVPVNVSAKTENPVKQKPKPKVGISAWVIQVGSFSKKENAQKLVDRLRKAQFDTMDPEAVDLRGRFLYRVRVGPLVQESEAKKMLPGIEKVSGLKGRIVRYP